MGEGLKLTLSALPGLTVDEHGRPLLAQPFVFQCPPLEEFKIARAFTFGNYDTIEDGQFTRRGGRQLKTWEFDTLVMEMGTTTHARNGQFIPAGRIATADGTDRTVRLAPKFDATARRSPGWVPFPVYDGSTRLPVPPAWFVKQLDAVHDAGCPFKLVASWAGGRDDKAFNQSADSLGPVLSCSAVMLGFTEGHKHGEGDSVYLESMSFSEWRDPTASQRGLGQGKRQMPIKLNLYSNGTATLPTGQLVEGPNGVVKIGVTAAWLSKRFYGDPGFWRDIFKANGLKGGSANTPLIQLPAYRKLAGNQDAKLRIIATVTIPPLSPVPPHTRHGSKPLLEQGSH